MASTCINNPQIVLLPEKFLDRSPPYSACTALTIGEMPDEVASSTNTIPSPSDLPEEPDPEGTVTDVSDIVDFEFRIEEPVNILPADQLFSDGKLFPLHFPVVHPEANLNTSTATDSSGVRSADSPELNRIINGVSVVDSFLYSPKAPKCSSRWKEILGLKKLHLNSSKSKVDSGNGNAGNKSFKYFLYRSSKSSNDSSINLPLLNDTDELDNEPASVPSRHSLSSSSSGHDPDDLPRLSLDSDKPLKVYLNTNPNITNPPRMKVVRTRTLSTDGLSSNSNSIRGVSISAESPRMNSSGKIVFQSLERSSSSPAGSFTGGPRSKHMGMERSYSGNVKFTPVLNVPVCSLRGFPLFSSSSSSSSRNQQMNNRSKTDRT